MLIEQDSHKNQLIAGYHNKKFPKREVDLSREGWVLITNTPKNTQSIEDTLVLAGRNKNDTDVQIEDIAYTLDGFNVVPNYVAVYKRSKDVKQKVPKEITDVIEEFSLYKRATKLTILLEVYTQIVKEREEKEVAHSEEANVQHLVQRFNYKEGEIAGIFYYFADELISFGLPDHARELEAKVRAHIPLEIEYFKPPLLPKSKTDIGTDHHTPKEPVDSKLKEFLEREGPE